MIAFGQLGYTGMPDNQQTALCINSMRRDGKVAVTYVFPISGKRLRKLLTLAQLDEEKASGKYFIRYS